MPLSSSGRLVVPPHTDVPSATRDRAQRKLRSLEKLRHKTAEDRGKQASRILRAGVASLHDAIGKQKLRALSEFTRRQADEMRASLRPPKGIGANRAALRAAAVREFDAYAKKSKIDVDAIQRIRTGLDAKLGGLGRPHFRKADHPAFTLLDAELLRKMRKAMAHGWRKFEPPYDGGYALTDIWLTQSKFIGTASDTVDQAIGQVGMNVHIDMTDVSDADMCFSTVEAGIAFWWQAPATGIPEVAIEAVNARSRHVVTQSEEWGSSSWKQGFEHDLEAWGTHPNLSLTHSTPVYKENFQGVDTWYNAWDSLEAGQTYLATFVLDGVVAAGDWVLIQAGASQYDDARLNDVTSVWDSQYRWFFKSVSVRIMP
jgi:hypothetical protein